LIYGMHGANRLSGNAITEALVTGRIAGETAGRSEQNQTSLDTLMEEELEAEWRRLEKFWYPRKASDTEVSTLSLRKKIQKTMWKGAGPLRTESELKQALDEIYKLRKECFDIALERQDQFALSQVEKIEAYHMTLVGEAIIKGAIQRRESRGAHVRLDYTEQMEETYSSVFKLNNNMEWLMEKVNLTTTNS
jgi:succinate dehydrogenase/fumarate reductase flavoprotein subunit